MFGGGLANCSGARTIAQAQRPAVAWARAPAAASVATLPVARPGRHTAAGVEAMRLRVIKQPPLG